MARGKAKETKSDENMLKEAILALSAEKHISVSAARVPRLALEPFVEQRQQIFVCQKTTSSSM